MYLLFFLLVLTVAKRQCGKSLSTGEIVNPRLLPACPPGLGFNANATCTQITIICPGNVNLDAVYGVSYPCGPIKSTVVLTNGGGGTSAFDFGYLGIYHKAGIQTVQVVYLAPGWNPTGVGRQNLKTAACRPATVHEYLFHTVHNSDLDRGYCLQGFSGGSAGIGYTLAWYEGGDYVDFTVQITGPIFSSVSEGCRVPIPADVRVCPPEQEVPYCGQVCESFLTSPSFASTFGTQCAVRGIALTGYPCACTNMTSTPEMIAWWESQNIVGPCADLDYPSTGISTWICKPPTNVQAGQSVYFAESVRSDIGFNQFLISNCTSAETAWTGIFEPTGETGLQASAMAMIEGCTPHHCCCEDDCDCECS